ncbi:hypothetical protein C8R44DRAFT_739807 [Mycena epipterygia]|nr:hypothetical protein C8R44DRAFT_739807 [Mycena epipterygia]
MQGTQDYKNSTQDDQRNRFLPDGGNSGGGGGQRVASQPPGHHWAASFLSSPPTQHLIPSSLGGSSCSPWGGLLSSSTRSASFSSQRFASTFEDNIYDARYNNNSNNYCGRSYAPDLPRSRSQSLATAPVGSWHTATTAFSIPDTQRYGELPGRSCGELGAPLLPHNIHHQAHSPRSPLGPPDASNMSPFVRDVGRILLDEGSFCELWEREHDSGLGGGG